MLEIEKDLKLWSEKRWAAIVAGIFVLQLVILFAVSRPVLSRAVYPREPVISMNSGEFPRRSREMLRLQNPLLFASASREGFSGVAWLHKEALPLPDGSGSAPPQYLAFQPSSSTKHAPAIKSSRSGRLELQPEVLTTNGMAIDASGQSEVRAQGFPGLRYSGNLNPPIQYFNDAVGTSVVGLTLQADGDVLSAVLLSSSGSRAADADALNLARRAEFTPSDTFPGRRREKGRPIVTGKLIFDWFALDSSRTNQVKR